MVDSVHNELWQRRELLIRQVLPGIALAIFLAMVAIGEGQIRSSPQWPPPPRHELGAWSIDDPTVLNWAAAINLPATIPMIWSTTNSGFAYAMDDHKLIIYLPWVFYVSCLWYFVGYRFYTSVALRSKVSDKSGNKYLVFGTQAFVTMELLYSGYAWGPGIWELHSVYVVCFWAWSILAILGWIDSVILQAARRRVIA